MNEFFKNLQQVWAGIPVSRRIPIIATTVAIIVGLGMVISYANKPHMDVLFSGMQPSEASKVVEFLKGKKIRYELEDSGATVMVPSASVYETRLDLAANGIPRAPDTGGGVGFELFDKPSFGMPDFMQKANYYRAIQGELARTIKQFNDISDARVMIVVPEERLFSKDRKEAKASVLIQMKQGRTLAPEQVAAIRFLVSNSVEGLQPNHVAIVDTAGRSLAPDDAGNGLGALSNTQLSVQRQYEDHLREKVQSMLDQTLGVGQSTVQITAELNFDTIQQTSERFDPKSAVVGAEHTTSEATHTKTQQANATVGSTPNTTDESNSGDKTQTEASTEKATAENQYDINRTVESLQKAVGVPTRITAAVFVNVRHSGTGPTSSVRPRTPQELQQLDQMVKEAIGFTQSDARKDSVTVQEIEFAPAFEQAEPATTAAATILANKNQWIPWVTQGCLGVLAVVVLLYLRSILRSSSMFESAESGEFSSLLSRYKKMADDALAEIDREKAQPNALSVDDLSKLIRDNPGNTSQALKAWMMRN
ncbi:MAG: flagellar basal-body MS-ring/collar protein FliF [Verrucomicrobium sp.]|nr:flagellar basal-body MS-ring/collar protein FliF [Verrucomicrobium sp.]